MSFVSSSYIFEPDIIINRGSFVFNKIRSFDTLFYNDIVISERRNGLGKEYIDLF